MADIFALTTDEWNPYKASKKYTKDGPWYDCFLKSGENAWLVFDGDEFLARVSNEQQAKNLVERLTR